jgi:DNA processing protein
MAYLAKSGVRGITYFDSDYPKRLKNCIDAPIMLYANCNANFNTERILGIVGTRNATEYGRQMCDQIIEELKDEGILFMSGLAYGIDIAAHKACVKRNLPNIGVVAHGLDRVYPFAHKEIAHKMMENGGLLTEFLSETIPDRQNFPKRNRIVAGMVDGLLVVETAENGGAVITAMLANSYNKDVMAIPGNTTNPVSRGCNALIKSNRAALIENGSDILDVMCWKNTNNTKGPMQASLFTDLSDDEQAIYDIIKEAKEINIDDITILSSKSPGTIAGVLLNLEFYGLIVNFPGKRFKLI